MVCGKTTLTEDPRGSVHQSPATAGQFSALQKCQKVQLHVDSPENATTIIRKVGG